MSERRERRPGGYRRRFRGKNRPCNGRTHSPGCPLYKDGKISYYDVDLLRRYLTDEGKIRPRRQTKICAKAQNQLARAIKRARVLALLPYTADHNQGNG